MLTEFIDQLNPFNLYGRKVGIEDLICKPLQSTETLMEDDDGQCRRIKAPSPHSTLWEKFVFWLQTHLNKKGHLEAIDKLISLFYEKLLQGPPQFTQELQEFNFQLDCLRALKNDYAFVCLKQGNPLFVEVRLQEIGQHAYSMFAYYQKRQALEQEEMRRKAFIFFQERIEQKLQELSLRYLSGLQKARFLMVAPAPCILTLFEERVQSFENRLEIVQDLYQQICDMEKMHEGKFTIPCIRQNLDCLQGRLCQEVQKIGLEAKILIRNLRINYRITPLKEEVKTFLTSLEIDAENKRQEELDFIFFQEKLAMKIARIQSLLKKKAKE